MASNMFGNMTSEGLEQSEDRLGGFAVLESDIYVGTIKAFYASKSKHGAMALNLVADFGGKEYRETIYITSKPTEEQKEKGLPGNNFFVKDGKKQPLPGFTTVNDICLVTCEKELRELETEEKTIKIYDYDLKKEMPTSVPMVTEAIGKPIALGIMKLLENKNEEVNGKYVPTAETRESNYIDKVFHPEAKITIAEARRGIKPGEGEFWGAWLEKNKGQLRDKRAIKDGQAPAGGGSAPKAGGAPAAGAAPKKSLFGPKQ